MVFSILEDEFVILSKGGLYRQAKVFRRGRGLYASYGSGFVRLHRNGATGVPSLRWEDLSVDFAQDKLGRLEVAR